MKSFSRRSLLATLGASLPFGLGAAAKASTSPDVEAPALRFVPFEESVRTAFAGRPRSASRTVEVGDSALVRSGVQGCHNDRPFAGFPAGHLRIVRAGSAPGPVRRGVRLYVNTVEIVLTGGRPTATPSRPLDFAALPPAPTFS